MSVAASVKSAQAASVADEEPTAADQSQTNETMTVYQNQRVIDANEEGITYKVCVMKVYAIPRLRDLYKSSVFAISK